MLNSVFFNYIYVHDIYDASYYSPENENKLVEMCFI